MRRGAWLGVLLLVSTIVPMAQAWSQGDPSFPGPLIPTGVGQQLAQERFPGPAPLSAELAHPLPDDWYPRSATGNALVLFGDADMSRWDVGLQLGAEF